jgi:ubiquinone/menaquinone biosynthesis C-methylase UbiE
MSRKRTPRPMPYTQAGYLLNPLRPLVLSPRTMVERLELHPQARVLELGPGPGYFSPAVAAAVPEGELVLVDVQPEMLAMARRRLERRGLTNVTYHCADALTLPLDDESCDVAFLVAVLGEVPDRAGCLREVMRVLKPGGLLSLTEFTLGDPDRILPPDLLKLTAEAGLQPAASYRGPIHYTAGFRRA